MLEVPRATSGDENCFGRMKRDVRKRFGKKDIGRELTWYGDYLCYVQNLKNESYVRLMFGSFDELPKVLSELPPEMVESELLNVHQRMNGYDVTKGGVDGSKVQFEDIIQGVKAEKRWREEREVVDFIRALGTT